MVVMQENAEIEQIASHRVHTVNTSNCWGRGVPLSDLPNFSFFVIGVSLRHIAVHCHVSHTGFQFNLLAVKRKECSQLRVPSPFQSCILSAFIEHNLLLFLKVYTQGLDSRIVGCDLKAQDVPG